MRLSNRSGIVLAGFLLLLVTAAAGSAQTIAAPSVEAMGKVAEVQQTIGAGRSFTVGYNPALEYSLDQLCGLKIPEGWAPAAPSAREELLAASLPSSFDWRTSNGVSTVKDQGGCGGCWAFSTVGVLESQIKRICGTETDLSEQYLISCNVSGWSCDGGGWFAHDYHWNLIPPEETAAGAVRESASPFQGTDVPCQGPYSHPYKISSWSYIGSRSGVPSVSAIKQAIYEHGPVGIALCAGSIFSAYTGGIFDANETCSGTVNHAVVLVGWNDDLGTDDGYWILKNSWGTGWGEKGYMRIRYGTSLVGYAANYVDFSACPVPSLPTVTIAAGTAKVIEPAAKGAFIVTRTGSTAAYLDVKYSVGGTAVSGTDYTALSGKVRIPAGASYRKIFISPIDDTVAESTKTIVVTLSSAATYNVGTPSQATVNVYDNDTVVTVVATQPTATESGTKKAKFTFTRTGDTSGTLGVKYTLSGTATNGVDYNKLTGTAAFAAGSSTKVIAVTPIEDTLKEGTETVILTISPNACYTVGSPSAATANILDND